jgi:hypothetical protein
MNMNFQLLFGFISKYFASISFVSAIGLFLALINVRRKSGINIKSSFTLSQSATGSDIYVKSVTLENMKDRPFAIYAIYLLISRNVYLKIESFENNPVILKSYETLQWKFGPVDHYASEIFKVSLKGMLSPSKNRIVLSTQGGRYITKPRKLFWKPSTESLKNSKICNVYPITHHYKGRRFGDLVRFAIIIREENQDDVIIDVLDSEIEFKHFTLTKSDIETKAKIMNALDRQKLNGLLICKSFEVIDLDEFRSSVLTIGANMRSITPVDSFFKHHIIGRVMFFKSRFHRRSKKAAKPKKIKSKQK